MGLDELISTARDALTVKRVVGEPYERDGVTVIPAARIGGGAGGGGGSDGSGQGEGVGFGLGARPAGAWIIRGGEVSWRPAVDVNRVVSTVGLVLVTYLLTRARIVRARATRRARRARR